MYLCTKKQHHYIMGKRAIIEALRHYFSTQPVLKAWLFGSFSRGEETKDSDVDIMVSLDKSKPIGLKFFGMWSDLEELLGRKVDLVSEGTLLPFAQESVERDKILVSGSAFIPCIIQKKQKQLIKLMLLLLFPSVRK